MLIGVQDLRLRCIMTSYDPDTLVQDKDITRSIYRCFDGKLALNCFVIEGGDIAWAMTCNSCGGVDAESRRRRI